jgi:tRNA A-37 threonylcarbamoyl transferase component Bud32
MADLTTFDQSLLAKAKRCTARVSKLEHQGQYFWVKRKEEKMSLRFRLQKGSAARKFDQERAALHRLAEVQAHVPVIVAEEPNLVVLPDYGHSLEAIFLGRNGESAAQKERALADGAAALASLHAQNVTHGRPYLRDICWKDGQATFIDFEYYRESQNSTYGHARDVVIFFSNGLAVAGKPSRELEIARDVYRESDPNGIWDHAQVLVRRMRWMNWLTKPIQMRREGKAKEFKAIPLTLAWFAD